MKRILSLLGPFLMALAAHSQTLNVSVGSVTYQFPAEQTGSMTYADGTTLTIMGKTFQLSDITSMSIDATSVTDNLVSITYSGSSATVTVAGNAAQYVEATVSGAHVTITQSNTDAVDGDELTYQLQGSSTDGSLSLDGSYKCTVSLAGLTLTNPSGAAISISNKKRIQLSAKSETVNTLTDCSGGSHKGCIYSKGQLQLQGNGTLNVYGNTSHAIKSGDYISIKRLTLNILSAASDGINCNGYFQLKSGTVSISGVGDDGIQCDLDGTVSTGQTTDHDDEDSGNVYLDGGSLTMTCSATAAKGIKSAGDVVAADGTIAITTTGAGEWDSTDLETKAAAGISADGNITISGGTVTVTSSGSGGKGIKCDSVLTVSGGTVSVTTTGALFYSNGTTTNANYTGNTDNVSTSYYSSPKGIKAGTKTQSGNSYTYAGGISITGGTVSVTTSGRNGEGIESKNYLTISGGHITVKAYDDGINSAQDLTISDGYVYSWGTNNDGIDSNGNCYISGGVIFAIGASSPEVAIDANSEEQKKLTFSGGTLVAIGGLESGSSLTQSCYSTSSWSKSTWYALYNGSTLALAFKTPSSGGSALIVSTSGTTTLKSGVSVSGGTQYFGGTANIGGSVSGGSSVSLSSYNSGGGNNPGGGGGGPGGPGGGGGGPGGGGGGGGRW